MLISESEPLAESVEKILPADSCKRRIFLDACGAADSNLVIVEELGLDSGLSLVQRFANTVSYSGATASLPAVAPKVWRT